MVDLLKESGDVIDTAGFCQLGVERSAFPHFVTRTLALVKTAIKADRTELLLRALCFSPEAEEALGKIAASQSRALLLQLFLAGTHCCLYATQMLLSLLTFLPRRPLVFGWHYCFAVEQSSDDDAESITS